MALVIYFLSTVLTWTAQMNQRFTSGEAERAHHSFATRGMVNLFIGHVAQDQNYLEAHQASNAVVAEVDGYTYRTWAEPDGNPNVWRVICEVDGKLVPFQATRSVVKTVDQGMILYADAGGTTGPAAISFMTMDDPVNTNWQSIDTTSIPQFFYRDKELKDPLGNSFVPPQFDSSVHEAVAADLLPTPVLVDRFAAYGTGPDGNLIAIYEPPGINDVSSINTPKSYPTLFTYDRASGSWSYEELVGPYTATGLIGQRLPGGMDGSTVIQDADGLLIRTPPSTAFVPVPSPPGGAISHATAMNGTVVTQMADGSIQRYTGSGWTSMVSPVGDYFTPEGEFVAGSGPVPVNQISISPNGSITALWQRSGVDTVFRYIPGDGTPENPPHWDATLPLTIDDTNVPFAQDLESITAMPGRFFTQVPGPPPAIYNGRRRMPDPPGPVIATGIYTLPDGRFYPADYSTY